jgi:hypothetical protein
MGTTEMGNDGMINLNSKWVKQILDHQHEDGSWGYFHTLNTLPAVFASK